MTGALHPGVRAAGERVGDCHQPPRWGSACPGVAALSRVVLIACVLIGWESRSAPLQPGKCRCHSCYGLTGVSRGAQPASKCMRRQTWHVPFDCCGRGSEPSLGVDAHPWGEVSVTSGPHSEHSGLTHPERFGEGAVCGTWACLESESGCPRAPPCRPHPQGLL